MLVKLSEIKNERNFEEDENKHKSPLEIKDDFVDFLKTIGIDYFMFYIPTIPDYYYIEKTSPYTNYPAFLIDYYIEKGYFDIDPTVDAIERSDKEYLILKDVMAEIERSRPLTAQQQKYFYDIRSIGFDNTLTVRFEEPFCTLDMTALRGDIEGIYREHKEEIIERFVHYRESLLNISVKKRGVILSEREKECLRWIARGKTAWETAKILDVSERTINFHINSCIKKLKANSRTHAVALAVAKKLIIP